MSERWRPRAERTERLVERLRCSPGAERERLVGELIEANMTVARTLARRYYGRGERAEDLDQTAYLGLTKAAHRFDPERGKEFLAFAVPTILGELRRHFRDGCWMVRPPRRIQDLQGRLAETAEELTRRAGRRPGHRELAEALGAPLQDVRDALAADGCFAPASLDRPLRPSSAADLSDTLGVSEHHYDRIETVLMLKPLLTGLPEREHRIIELRFFWDWTQAQIAQDVGVTQMQVSRILTRLVERLRRESAVRAPAVA